MFFSTGGPVLLYTLKRSTGIFTRCASFRVPKRVPSLDKAMMTSSDPDLNWKCRREVWWGSPCRVTIYQVGEV